MRPLIAIGGGGHLLSLSEVVDITAFLDSRTELWYQTNEVGVPCWGGNDQIKTHPGCDFVIAVGDPCLRSQLYDVCAAECVRVIDHPVMMGARVAMTADIGTNVLINVGAVVEHGATVGDHSHIAPEACVLGEARVGERVLVGANSTILPGRVVGDDAVIGAGVTVLRDVEEGELYVGGH